MASNTQLSQNIGTGDVLVTKDRTHDGDAAKQQVICVSGVTGTEGAYTYTDIQAGNGLAATALRVTVASDSTGVISVDDNGGSLTVDATALDIRALTNADVVTAELSATDNAVLDSIAAGQLPDGHAVTVDNAAGASAVNIQDGGNSITVDASALDVRALTNADVVTAELSATDNAVLDSIAAGQLPDGHNVTIDNASVTVDLGTNNDVQGAAAEGAAVSGNPFLMAGDDGTNVKHVTVDAAGHLQVDVLSGGGGGTQYTEADAAAANPVGTQPVFVSDSTPAPEVTEGQVVAQRATRYGAAYAQIVDSSGNFIDTFGGSGGTASTDDGAFTAGSGQGTPMMGFATADAVDSGDVGVVGMNTSRALHVSIQEDSVGIGGGIQYTEGDTDATITGMALMVEDAADTLRAATGDVTNGLDVDVTRVQGTVTVSATALDTRALTNADVVTAELSATDNAVLDSIAAGQLPDGHNVTVDNPSITVDASELTAIEAGITDLVSTNNSTTTPLGISGTFVPGTSDDCLGYSAVTITLFADQDSTTDGMKFEFSTDNSNWDDSYAFTMTANETRRFQFPVSARYFRVNYTNDTTGQGAFRVQTILHRRNTLTSIHRIEDNVSTDRSAQLVKAGLVAQINGSGDFIPIQATASGVLKIGGAVEVDTWSAGTLTVDNAGTFATQATQAGTWNVNNVSGTISLPTGAATAANQLPDGHNVTVDNASGASAVNIQDGGNVITVDGTIIADAGTNLNTSALALETGGNLATVAGAVSAGQMQVDVVAALPAGTNNIGDVDVATQPARDRTTDNVGVAVDTDTVMQDTTARTVAFDSISSATSGDNTLLAAQGAGNKIRVLSYVLISAGTVNVRFESGAGGTALSGVMSLVANSGISSGYSPVGHFETAANALLNLELSAAIQVSGHYTYVVVT